MDKVFVYWDNSNIFHEAQRLAEEQDEGPDARYRVRIQFDNLLRLAHADRPLQKAFAAGSVPPEMLGVWNRMEAEGVEVELFDRGDPARGEQQMPDHMLQLRMLTDALDYNGTPGIVTLLTGDGAGYFGGGGFHGPWNGCIYEAGGWKSSRGGIRATSECGAGRRRTVRSSRSTTSIEPSPFSNRRNPDTSLRRPARLRRWTSRNGRWPDPPEHAVTQVPFSSGDWNSWKSWRRQVHPLSLLLSKSGHKI